MRTTPIHLPDYVGKVVKYTYSRYSSVIPDPMYDDQESQPARSNAMLQDSYGQCIGLCLDGSSSHDGWIAAKDPKETHAQGTRTEERGVKIRTLSIEPFSSSVGNVRESAGKAMTRLPSRTDKTITGRQENPPASVDPPRKRHRSKVPTGPKAPIPRRRSSVPVRRKGQDLISFHRQSCRLFQSLGGTLASTHEWTTATNQPHQRQPSEPDTLPSSPCITKTDNGFAYLTFTTTIPRFKSVNNSRRTSINVSPPLPQFYDAAAITVTNTASLTSVTDTSSSSLGEKSTSPSTSSSPPHNRPHPFAVMPWTSIESRRAEYAEIDRSNRGLGGLLKRLTRRWCHGGRARRGLFGSMMNAETESVRRYRMVLNDAHDDSDDDNDEKEHDGWGAEGKETRWRTKRWRDMKWNCLH